MGITNDNNLRSGTPFSNILSGIRNKKLISFLLPGIVFLSIGSIALIILKIWLPAIICTALIIAAILLVIKDYYSSLNLKVAEIDEMQEVIEMKEKYLSDFSHRIRTPLNNFSFIIEHLIENKSVEDQKEILETLIASTTNMVEAVNDLTMKTAQVLSYESRKEIIFNLSSALQATIELFELNSGNSIEFNVDFSENLSTKFLGDPITIKQVFLDIFNSLADDKAEQTRVNLVVTNEGSRANSELVGFKIHVNREIQSFDQSKISDGKVNSMAVNLIGNLNGTYSTSSSTSESVFDFTLPLKIATKEEKQSKVAERIQELNTESKGKKKMSDADVLLVEDNPTNQKIVLLTLKSLVKSIDTAVTGKEALDKFGKSNYDVILMDIQLPIMDGITAAEKIREIEKSTSRHTPIIAITANAMIGDKEKCLSAGIDEYLSKPFQPGQLISVIEKLVTA